MATSHDGAPLQPRPWWRSGSLRWLPWRSGFPHAAIPSLTDGASPYDDESSLHGPTCNLCSYAPIPGATKLRPRWAWVLALAGGPFEAQVQPLCSLA
jgi:hypothetical protein